MTKDGPTLARLATLAALVPPGARVADIGTDAALLPRLLLGSGRAAFCVAIDSSATAIRSARAVATDAGPRLVVRLGFGFAAVDARDRIDVVVLSGLGARTILRILDDPRREALEPLRLVLQPQTEPGRVRRWLATHGFRIVDERTAAERGRSYVVMAAERPRPNARRAGILGR